MTPARILAVDDEPDFELLITQRFRRQIRAEEFAFSFARHGEEALSVLEAEPEIELMLLDINMPVMDGLKLISLIRGDEGLKEIPIVVITTEGANEDRRRALELGANEYLCKPIQANQVLSVVKGLLKVDCLATAFHTLPNSTKPATGSKP